MQCGRTPGEEFPEVLINMWHGKVHLKDLPEGRVNVELEIFSSWVKARASDTVYEFNMQDAEIEVGGLEHDVLYIRSKNVKEPLLVVRDSSFTRALLDLRISEVTRVLEKNSGIRKRRKYFAITGWALVMVFFAALFFSNLGYKALLAMIPPSVDESIGKAAFPSAVASMTGQYLPVKNAQVDKAIEIIQKRLESGMDHKKFTYRIEVFESNLVNAVALPGGYVAVFSGLIKKADSPEELAGVLAHEMIHAENRHAMQQIMRRFGFFLGLQILLGDAEGVIASLADGAAVLASLGYSREMESEADREGALAMIRAKISPVGLAEFFEKISVIEEDEFIKNGNSQSESSKNSDAGSNKDKNNKDLKEKTRFLWEWLSTHPDTRERVAAIKKIAEQNKDNKYLPLNVSWRSLQKEF